MGLVSPSKAAGVNLTRQPTQEAGRIGCWLGVYGWRFGHGTPDGHQGNLTVGRVSSSTTGTNIDWNNDRITFTTNDVVTTNGVVALRTQTFACKATNSPALSPMAMALNSVDGLKSFNKIRPAELR
jgi:hypothetical protein